MAKAKKTVFFCQNCGYESPKWLGQCPGCKEWNTFVEETVLPKSSGISGNGQGIQKERIKPATISEIDITEDNRITTNIEELDRVLGGGLVQGSMVLVGGDPGIGKSTLLLQVCKQLSDKGHSLLYVSGEESLRQIKMRAQRIGTFTDKMKLLCETNLETIKAIIENEKPEAVIIDSIQTMYNEEVSSAPGSVSQVRESTGVLMKIAKGMGISMFIVGHVTKEGVVAGPRMLEHMVDTVIYFEGDRYKSYRLLRCMKNRFGTTNEVGVFNMCDDGLHEISNPSELFLNERTQNNTPGSVIIATNEGTRPLLIEIQALVGTTSYPSPRRVSNGIDYNRLLQILAVLEKRIGLNLSKQDVYVNVIGGLEIDEPAADLGVALAVATCARDVCVSPDTVIVGEIGLSGEIRAINNLDKRIKESEKLGFKKIIVPHTNTLKKEEFKNINIVQVKRLMDAITACVSKSDKTTVS